ncbi:MAG: hypothetical protein AAF571_04720 [Verrucomicrobiota bacterium]
MKVVGVFVLACGLSVAAGLAQTVNVNFFTSGGPKPEQLMNGTAYVEGAAPFSYSGTTWTDSKQRIEKELPDASGVKTQIGFKVDLKINRPIFYSSGVATNQLVSNYLATQKPGDSPPPTTAEVQINGLEPARAYDIALISQGDKGDQGGEFIINGMSKTSAGSSPEGPLQQGISYVVFSKVAASNAGTINIIWKSRALTQGHFAVLNGFQIVPSDANSLPAPEATSYASVLFP